MIHQKRQEGELEDSTLRTAIISVVFISIVALKKKECHKRTGRKLTSSRVTYVFEGNVPLELKSEFFLVSPHCHSTRMMPARGLVFGAD